MTADLSYIDRDILVSALNDAAIEDIPFAAVGETRSLSLRFESHRQMLLFTASLAILGAEMYTSGYILNIMGRAETLHQPDGATILHLPRVLLEG